jgi:aspartyl protease family protein
VTDPIPHSLTRQARRGALLIAMVWVGAGGLLYGGFKWMQARERQALQPYSPATGELVIPRQRDGHFYVAGEVNRVPVLFLVDTGASAVSISTALADQAGLPEGRPVTLRTANGERPGRLVQGVPVRVGPIALNDVTVVTGLSGLPPQQALLGQSFLRHFDVQLREKDMLMRPRAAPVAMAWAASTRNGR